MKIYPIYVSFKVDEGEEIEERIAYIALTPEEAKEGLSYVKDVHCNGIKVDVIRTFFKTKEISFIRAVIILSKFIFYTKKGWDFKI